MLEEITSTPHGGHMSDDWQPRCAVPRDLVRPVPLDPSGVVGPTRGQARSNKWRPSSHGFHVPSVVDSERVEQRILEQAVRLPEGGAVTGWAALRMHGGAFFDGRDPRDLSWVPVPVVCPVGQLRRSAEVDVLRDRLEPDEIVVCGGVPCTTAERATFDAMRHAADLRAGVVVLDMAAAAEVTSIRRLTRYADAHAGWRGVIQVRAALELADEHSRSPFESALRLIWQLDAGFSRPLCNRAVFTLDGRLIGVPDLLDPEAGVLGEYDGGQHQARSRRRRDAEREAAFRRAGLETFKVVTGDIGDVDLVVERMEDARRRALWLPPEHRGWTLRNPYDEGPEETLDFRLDRRDLAHEQHLRWSTERS